MNFEILDSNRDKEKWLNIFNNLPNHLKDIYCHPDYTNMHKFLKGSKSLLFIYYDKNLFWIHTFIYQPINFDYLKVDYNKWYDIESVYGYGGPIANTTNKKFIKEANDTFDNWAAQNNVIAAFLRFNPIIKNEKLVNTKTDVIYDRNTISKDLKKYDPVNLPFKAKVRNMIKKVEKENIIIKIFNPIEYFDSFKQLYISTMDRIKADDYYKFNEKYFTRLSSFVKNNGMLIGATLDNNWIAAAIFLKGGHALHYHLSARNPDYRLPGVTNAILAKGMEMGAIENLDVLHLGGGNSSDPNDSLFKFKIKMGDISNKYYIGKRIFNHEIYNLLKKEWENTFPHMKEKHSNKLLCYRLI